MRVSSSRSIAIIGGGAWGTALAVHAARLNHRVGLWVREPEVVAGIRASRENADYLPGIRIPDSVEASSRLEEALDGRGLVIAVVPTSFARDVYAQMAPLLSSRVPVAVAAKGIEEGSLASLYFDYERNVIEAKLVFRPSRKRDDGHYVVPLAVQVPLGNLTLVPDKQRHIGRFRIAFAVMNDKGEVSPVQLLESVTVQIPEQDIEDARQRYYTYETQLLMRRGASKVAVSIHDELADQSSFVHRTVSVGDASSG